MARKTTSPKPRRLAEDNPKSWESNANRKMKQEGSYTQTKMTYAGPRKNRVNPNAPTRKIKKR